MKITICIKEFPSHSLKFIAMKVKSLVEMGVEVTVISWGFPKNPAHQEILAGLNNLKIIYLFGEKSNNPFRRIGNWLWVVIKSALVSPRETYSVWSFTKSYRSWVVRLRQTQKLLPLVSVHSDIYHFEFGIYAAEYLDFLKFCQQPCMVSFRGADIDIHPHWNPELKQRYREVIQHADRIHCVSEAIADTVAKYGDRRKIFINRPSIDASFFSPVASSKRDPNLIVSIARLKWKKGLTYALLAISQLVPKFPNLRYIIVGNGPDTEELRFYSFDLGIQDHVEFYGWAESEKIKEILGKAAVYLLSSLEEGIANVVLEAMAMEVPVVTTDAGGMKEVITDGVEGFVVPRYNPSAIAEKLELLMRDEKLRTSMGKHGRDRVVREFTIERQVRVFIKEYESMRNYFEKKKEMSKQYETKG